LDLVIRRAARLCETRQKADKRAHGKHHLNVAVKRPGQEKRQIEQ